jgi:hypothetical protein
LPFPLKTRSIPQYVISIFIRSVAGSHFQVPQLSADRPVAENQQQKDNYIGDWNNYQQAQPTRITGLLKDRHQSQGQQDE